MAKSLDGGYGWVILAAVTIINLAVQPIQQNFGLVFGELFTTMSITAAQVSLILHLNSSIMCSLGLISGPMMRRFSFRSVACVGSLIIVTGIFATAFSESLAAIIVTYCILIGIGQGVLYPAIGLAINTYFREKRKMAMGLTVALTGLGPIVMPQLITKCLESYATAGTILILAGIAVHSFIGAIVLWPLEQNEVLDVNAKALPSSSKESCHDNGEKVIEMTDLCRLNYYSPIEQQENKIASNCPITDEQPGRVKINDDKEAQAEENEEFLEQSNCSVRRKEKSVLSRMSTSMDLQLLNDSRYLIIMLGMGVSFVSELNFNLMMPIILKELAHTNNDEIANVMSIMAFADISGRLCVPLLAQKNWLVFEKFVCGVASRIHSWQNNSCIMVQFLYRCHCTGFIIRSCKRYKGCVSSFGCT